MTRAQIENKYGVKVRDDSYHNPMTGRFQRAYKIYSADGCQWENGLKSIKAVEQECGEWEMALLEIKAKRYGKGGR